MDILADMQPSLADIQVTTGVTSPLTAPMQSLGFLSGLGTAFSLSAAHKLEKGAVVQAVTAVHISLSRRSSVSVSTQIAVLRRLLSNEGKGEIGEWFKKVREVCLVLPSVLKAPLQQFETDL